MLGWFRRNLARKVGLIAGASAAAGTAAFLLVWPWLGGGPPPPLAWGVGVVIGGLAAAFVTWWLVGVFVSRRLSRLADAVLQAERGDFLTRVTKEGNDEIADAGAAFNRLLQKITALHVDIIDQKRELTETQEELRLKQALAAKSKALESRLNERALLFETLRLCTSTLDLDEILGVLAARVAIAAQAREVGVLVAESLDGKGQERFVVRGVWGFANPQALIGRSLARGEGVAGEVADSHQALVLADVTLEPDYLSFWGEAPREGSFAAVPIAYGGTLLGMLCVTHGQKHAFDEGTVRLLTAFADQAALAARNAHLYAAMRELTVTDELTGLANRRRLASRLEHEWDRRDRTDEPFSVLALDVDHFKKLNDREGHPVGDAALRQLGQVLLSQFRRVDTAARVGGEEFVVLLSATKLEQAAAVAEKLRGRIAGQRFAGGAAQPGGRLTISIGEASTELGAGDSTALLSQADSALYAAKRAGRNRVMIYDETMPLAAAG